MYPHADDLDGFDFVENLIHKAMLDIDPAGKRPGQVAHELFEGGRGLIRILG
jgi:hypothetical protein